MLESILNNSDNQYLKEAVKMLYSSNILLQEENKRLLETYFGHEQAKLELNDKLTILKKRFIFKGSEKLKTLRPINPQKQMLLHNQFNETVAEDIEVPLPSAEVIHTIDKESDCGCPKCGNDNLQEMNKQFEESVEIDVIERTYKEIVHKRQKYRCRSCDSIITSKGSPKLTKGSKYSIKFATSVAVDKFSYHLPLERIRRRIEEQGLKVDVKTLYGLTERLYLNLSPIQEMIRKEILDYGYVHIDETRGKILKNNSNGYIWAMANLRGAYFQYELTRSGKVAEEMLKNYSGYIINDGFVGYKRFSKVARPKIKVSNCWSHVRRKFIDCVEDYPIAIEILELIQELYEYEYKAKSFDELKDIRQEYSKLTIKKIRDWLMLQGKCALPRSSLEKAINYTLNMWYGLNHFLKDPMIPLDNNAVERALRNPVKGRDNYNGYMSINGADTAMFFYTIIETCKKLRLNPRKYLKEMSLRHWNDQKLLTPYQYLKAISI